MYIFSCNVFNVQGCCIVSVWFVHYKSKIKCESWGLWGQVRTFPSCQGVGGDDGGCRGQVDSTPSHSVLEKASSLPAWDPPPPPHALSRCGCVYKRSEHQCTLQPDARPQTLRSIRQTPTMRGCSSRAKPAQNPERAGKTRRFNLMCVPEVGYF